MPNTLHAPLVRQRLIVARTGLLLDEPFFGPLALRLDLTEDLTCDTAWVDGQRLGYNPAFIDTLSARELTTLLIHEVMHCANGHPWRREGRDPTRWNEACDRVINPLLRDAGYTLPTGGLVELGSDHLGRSAEWVYDRLPASPSPANGGGAAQPGTGQPGDGASGTGQPQPGDSANGSGSSAPEPGGTAPNPLGEVRDAQSEDGAGTDGTGEPTATEAEWQRAVQQAAAMARAQGRLPGALDRFAQQTVKPRVDWRAALRRFVQERASEDYSYARPNARYVAHGLILPALRSEELGPLVVAVDTSGSVDAVLLAQFTSELNAIADEVRPRRVHVLYADASVRREDVFERGDPIVLRPVGGGGTDFRPVFTRVAQFDEPPIAVVYLTDLYGSFPAVAPDVETLWATPTLTPPPVPFGDVLPLN